MSTGIPAFHAKLKLRILILGHGTTILRGIPTSTAMLAYTKTALTSTKFTMIKTSDSHLCSLLHDWTNIIKRHGLTLAEEKKWALIDKITTNADMFQYLMTLDKKKYDAVQARLNLFVAAWDILKKLRQRHGAGKIGDISEDAKRDFLQISQLLLARVMPKSQYQQYV